MLGDYGGAFSASIFHSVIGSKQGYETKKEAENALQKILAEARKSGDIEKYFVSHAHEL